jgi:hypothetical protein
LFLEHCKQTDGNHCAVPPFVGQRHARSVQALEEQKMGKGLLLWLIGIPIPIILVIWLFGGLN